jgi:hypothetical protein
VIIPVVLIVLAAASAMAACPEEPASQNYTGGGRVVCPCFVAGEEAGAVLNAPQAHYPIEILRVGIGWGSQFGGSPQQMEAAVNIYGGGLPSPGSPIFSLPGPVLGDGFINEYNLEPLPGEIIVSSGAFTVTLAFQNDNAGNPYAPSMVHDGNGCQGGKNVIYAVPGGWMDACSAGVTGDWVVYAVYRQVNCSSSTGEEVVSSETALLPEPNPFITSTRVKFLLPTPAPVRLVVCDAGGRLVSTLVSGILGAGHQSASWDGTDGTGRAVAAGTYFFHLDAAGRSETRRVVLIR